MRTEFSYFVEHLNAKTEHLEPADLNVEELTMVKDYVETTRHIQEINSLFHIFRFNLKNILHNYNLFGSDKVERKIEYDFEVSDDIAINALTIGFISSGKTLIESIESFLKMNSEKLHQEFKKNCLMKEYDDNFHYRLLLRLRDYAQHGHFPVWVNFDNKFCFDLNHILSTPHFNHNSNVKNQMDDIEKDIFNKYSDYPYIAFTLSLAEFNVCTTRIYLEFLDKIRSLLHGSVENIESLLKKHPEIIHESSDIFNGHIFYELVGDNLHSFNSKDNPEKMILQYINFVSGVLEKEQLELDKLRSNFKFT